MRQNRLTEEYFVSKTGYAIDDPAREVVRYLPKLCKPMRLLCACNLFPERMPLPLLYLAICA